MATALILAAYGPLIIGATTPPSSCGAPLHGIGLGGSDNLNSSFPVSKDNGTIEVCCGACDADPQCSAWTLNLEMDMCWLKIYKPTSIPQRNKKLMQTMISGVKSAPIEPCKGRCPNILYLMADDMRPQLGTYGHSYMKTPNLDKLAATGLQFDFAYTNFAYCAPSRNSFLSGRRPDRTRALNFLSTFRMAPGGGNWTTMPEFFKMHGYFTSSAGKIFHDGMDDPISWTYPSNQTAWVGCSNGDLMPPEGIGRNYCGVTNQSTRQYTDEDLALNEGLKRMDLAVESGKPWWVSIGVHRPHTNYRVPRGFYGTELYPAGSDGNPDTVKPPLYPNPPEFVPYVAGNWQGGDIADPAHGCPSCVVPPNRSVEYRRWYYAAVSWADHALGRALDQLDSLGPKVSGNTITVFHADHGYQLGELNEWSKKTDTELATHVPLIIRVPWMAKSIGRRTTVKTELVDIYRTLADLAELTTVEPVVQDSVQGSSVAAVFEDPMSPALQDKRAYSQIGRCYCGPYCPKGPVNNMLQNYCPCNGPCTDSVPEFMGVATSSSFSAAVKLPSNVLECGGNACCKVPVDGGNYDYIGYTMRTKTRRFTAWVPFNGTTARVDWALLKGNMTELYDLTNDTGRDFDFSGYSYNLAGQVQYAQEVATLLADLKTAVATWY